MPSSILKSLILSASSRMSPNLMNITNFVSRLNPLKKACIIVENFVFIRENPLEIKFQRLIKFSEVWGLGSERLLRIPTKALHVSTAQFLFGGKIA